MSLPHLVSDIGTFVVAVAIAFPHYPVDLPCPDANHLAVDDTLKNFWAVSWGSLARFFLNAPTTSSSVVENRWNVSACSRKCSTAACTSGSSSVPGLTALPLTPGPLTPGPLRTLSPNLVAFCRRSRRSSTWYSVRVTSFPPSRNFSTTSLRVASRRRCLRTLAGLASSRSTGSMFRFFSKSSQSASTMERRAAVSVSSLNLVKVSMEPLTWPWRASATALATAAMEAGSSLYFMVCVTSLGCPGGTVGAAGPPAGGGGGGSPPPRIGLAGGIGGGGGVVTGNNRHRIVSVRPRGTSRRCTVRRGCCREGGNRHRRHSNGSH